MTDERKHNTWSWGCEVPLEQRANGDGLDATARCLVCEPEERTVDVVDRGTSISYEGLAIRTVTLVWRCPQCGEYRGKPYAHRFAEDGEWYTCDRWDNPCGHVDHYSEVLAEARARTGGAS